MRNPTVHVERVLPAQAQLTVGEADAILEAAYLMTAADGTIDEAETEGFRRVASRLRGLAVGSAKPVNDRDLEALLKRFGTRSEHAERVERLAALRKQLERPEARELAYKVAFAMSLADLEASTDEEELDQELVIALGLTEDKVAELADQVYEVLGADDEGES
jgi:tellurite resistance protein